MKKIYMIVSLAFVFTMATFAQGLPLQTKALKYDGKVVKSMKMQKKAEAEGDELITPPESAVIETDWVLAGSYYNNNTPYTNGNDISVAFDGDEVWVMGLSYLCPEGWIKGTLADGVVEFPNGQYVGLYGETPIYACGSDDGSALASLKFQYDEGAMTLTLTNYYIENTNAETMNFYFYSSDLVMQKIKPTPTDIEVEPSTKTAVVSWTEVGASEVWNLRYREFIDPEIANKVWDFEDDAQLEGWTSIDADGDGNNWSYANSAQQRTNSGTGVMTSASYDNNSGALTPDNWIITPAVTLGGKFSFYAAGQDTNYAAEVFAVYICTGDPTSVDNFEKISDDITATGTFTQYEFDLSAYEGEGYLAIRHYNVTDMFRLNIDDVKVEIPGGKDIPDWTVVEGVTEKPYTIEDLKPRTDYEVQVQSAGSGLSDWTASTVFTTLPIELIAPIELEAENITANSADVKWTGNEEDMWNLRYRPTPEGYTFEDASVGLGDWTTIDADGDGYTWSFSQSDGINAKSGTGVLTSASYINSGALTPDNWLVSPKVALEGTFSFWACGQDPNYAEEHFAVYVTTGDATNTEEFEQVTDEFIATGVMTQYSVDLSKYEGAEGNVAIRHFNCTDMFRLNVDNIVFDKDEDWTLLTDVIDNPFTLMGLAPETSYDVEVQANDGVEVGPWSELYQFTTTAIEAPALTADNITDSTADLSWEPAEGDSWNIRYREYVDEEHLNKIWDFEDSNQLSDWSIIDADGDGNNWGYTSYSGNYILFSASYINNVGAVTPDNWIISPEVPLGGKVKFDAWGLDSNYPSEVFAVYVAQGDVSSTDDFVLISDGDITATGTQTTYEFDLSAYEGTGRIAIRHYNVTDQFYLAVDNFKVEVPDGKDEPEWIYVNDVTSQPYTLEDLESSTTYEAQIMTIAGEYSSDWSESCIFTTGELTGVEKPKTEVKSEEQWYNINGVKLAGKPAQKGVYIVNGKKVVVK